MALPWPKPQQMCCFCSSLPIGSCACARSSPDAAKNLMREWKLTLLIKKITRTRFSPKEKLRSKRDKLILPQEKGSLGSPGTGWGFFKSITLVQLRASGAQSVLAASVRGERWFEAFGLLWCEPRQHVYLFNVPTWSPTPSCTCTLRLQQESNSEGNQLRDHTCLCLSAVCMCVCVRAMEKHDACQKGTCLWGIIESMRASAIAVSLVNPSLRLEQKHKKLSQLYMRSPLIQTGGNF